MKLVLKGAIEVQCVYEVGGSIVKNNFLYTEQESAAISPASFYDSLAQVGKTLNFPMKKFEKLSSPQLCRDNITAQKQVAERILNDLISQELTDINTLLMVMK